MTLPSGLTEANYRDFHAALVEDAKLGRWTILDFWDSLPWLRTGADWTPWRAFLAALYGLPMTKQELEIYRLCTGRKQSPSEPATEAWMPIGRRGRKSAVEAVLASYVGIYRDHTEYMAPGEFARIPLLSKTKTDAQQVKRYIEAIFAAPSLAWLVEKDPTAESIRLSTMVDIDIRAATISAGRGPSSPLAILDEVAFFRSDEAAHPDVEIVTGIKGSFANVRGALLIGASSPYARRGVLYQRYKDYYGKDGPVLVWKAPTITMHRTPEIEAHVANEYASDPVAARAEYGAEFRTDVELFITEEIVEAVTEFGVEEHPPLPGIQYVAFTDPSGGISDPFTMGIAHWESESVIVLDLLAETRPTEDGPFKPAKVTEGLCRILARYGVRQVEGDRYAGEWPREAFDKGFCDHEGEPCAPNAYGLCELRYSVTYLVSDFPKREIYKDVLHLLTDKQARLIDSARLRAQLTSLERRTSASGDIIDHPPGGHDDVANAAAGVLCRAGRLKLRPRKVVEPPKTLIEARQRDLHNNLKRRIAAQRKEPESSGGGWI